MKNGLHQIYGEVDLPSSEVHHILYHHGLLTSPREAKIIGPAAKNFRARIHAMCRDTLDLSQSRIEAVVEMTKRYLDEKGIKKCAVAGTSMGAAYALRTAQEFPDRVKAVMLLNPLPPPYPEIFAAMPSKYRFLLNLGRIPGFMEPALHVTRYGDPAYRDIDSFIQSMTEEDRRHILKKPHLRRFIKGITRGVFRGSKRIRRIAADMRQYWNTGIVLDQIRQPVIISQAKKDETTPPGVAQKFMELLPEHPDSRLILTQGGHYNFSKTGGGLLKETVDVLGKQKAA